ncbi:MAG: hypothetical protein K5871_03475 [Lachnospiraceae bacterium]|nr:hypothetical protein [Lachnospiraceae bacterium]
MAVSFVAQKCACGGKLEFNPAKKVWICKYCGTVVEREATFDKVHVDGIEGVDDVVRQTLMDIANQKMESAAKNLDDCERKGHKAVGTLLAHISYNLANISTARSQDEARASIDKVKIYGNRLKTEFPDISAEEINLYESFGEDAADIFANLLVMYDTLGDSGRVEYVASKLKPESVFSPHANKTLLKVSIRRGDYDVVDKIVKNIGHVDRKSALQEILDDYPGNDKKIELIGKVFDNSAANALTKRYFEGYFAESKDPVTVRAFVTDKLNTTDIHVNAETVVKNAQNLFTGYDDAKMLFDSVYGVKISDQETEALLVFCLMVNKLFDVQKAFFDTLTEKNVFVALSARAVISFLDSAQFSGKERAEILGKMLGFNLDPKGLDAIYNYYLNNNTDDAESRALILDVILQPGIPITPGTVKEYVLKTQTDGDGKLGVIEKIFATGINKTYLGDLLSDYALHSADPANVKSEVFNYLSNQGFRADSGTLTQYVTDSNDDKQTKIAKVKNLIRNGTPVKADTLNAYIMSLQTSDELSEEMINILTAQSYTLGIQAYGKYLLFCKDIDKVHHNDVIMRGVSGDLSTQTVSISHNGNTVTCNVFQAYLLNAFDSYDVASSIAAQFNAAKVKVATDIIVNGAGQKFKKYAADNKASLTPLSLQLCEENRVFSLF